MADPLHITVCFSPAPRTVCELALRLPAGATLQEAVVQAIAQPAWPADWPEQACRSLMPGLWGRKARWDTPLREGDRVELYRALQVDPKVARRQRFNQQGARRAGLFAKKRPGAAAGY
jgi:putative ubiquitin-RnfH superfamily antitoxin RatB of RatAB toxin-antitoxin module